MAKKEKIAYTDEHVEECRAELAKLVSLAKELNCDIHLLAMVKLILLGK